MKFKRIGAAVGVAAVLAAVPLASFGSEQATGPTVPVAHADPTTLTPGDPGYDTARQWEKQQDDFNKSFLPSLQQSPPSTVTVTPTTVTPSTHAQSDSGLPWWAWVLIVPGGLVGGVFLLGKLGNMWGDFEVQRAEARVAELEARYPDSGVQDYPDDDDDELDDDDEFKDDEDEHPHAAVEPAQSGVPTPPAGGNLLSSLRQQKSQ